MDKQRIPEHKMNTTKTVGQILESLGNDQFFNISRDRDKSQTTKSNKKK